MADVTRWEPERGWFCDFDTGIWRRKPDGNYEPLPHGTVVIPEADHLAALERVRVETLREERAAIMALRAFIVGKTALRDWDINEVVKGFDDAVAAIDRLINAATTGASDDC